jgi:hypothetical protein
MKLRFSLLSLCALLAGAAAQPAAAENEAYYFPDGLLYVPCVNMQDNGGNTYTNYAAFFRKSSRSWNFKLYGLAPSQLTPHLRRAPPDRHLEIHLFQNTHQLFQRHQFYYHHLYAACR